MFVTYGVISSADYKGLLSFEFLKFFAFVAMIGLPVALLVTLFVGAPYYYFLKNRGLANGYTIIIGATIFSLLLPSLLFSSSPMPVFAACGAAVGALFWLIVRRDLSKPVAT